MNPLRLLDTVIKFIKRDYGFSKASILTCEITPHNIHEYLSDKDYLKLHPINKEYSKIIDNKLYLPFLLKDFQEFIPAYYYLIDQGRLMAMDSFPPKIESVITLLKEKIRLTLKHCASTRGVGFYLLHWADNQIYVNNQSYTIEKFETLLKTLDYYIITEYIEQHEYASKIFPNCVNSIRVICMRDPLNYDLMIPISFHRFGMGDKLVDNIGAKGGGITAYIDVKSGTIKNIGTIKEDEIERKFIGNIVHKETNQPITGLIIPHWEETIQKIKKIMDSLPFLKYAGFDIVITKQEFKILEINSLTDISGLQLEQGVLKDPGMRRFFTRS